MTTTTKNSSVCFQQRTVYKPWTGLIHQTWYTGKTLTVDTRTGVVNPAWKSMVEQGLDAGSPYSRYIGPKVETSMANWRWRFLEQNTNTRLWIECYYRVVGELPLMYLVNGGFLPSSRPVHDYTSLEQKAAIAFLNKVRESVTPFKALPFLGELRETIRMVKHPLSGIAKATRRYNRQAGAFAKLKKAGDIADAMADSYLQWTYGVKPLFGDIEGAVTAFKDLCSTDVKPIPVSVTFRQESSGLRYSPGPRSFEYGASCLFSVVKSDRVKLQIKGAIKSDVMHPVKERVLPTIGATLDEFVPTLWELLPYSFLIDYVTNVGDILGAKAVALADLAWYWQSVKTETCYSGIVIPLTWSYPDRPAVQSPYPIPSVANVRYIDFKRLKPSLGVRLFSSFEFQLPTVGQWINSAVLGFAQMRDRFR